MARVSYLTSRCMVRGSDELREDHWEHDLQMEALVPACASRDIELVETIWDDASFDPARFDAVVVGTTWDYTDRPEEFFSLLDRAAAAVPVFNPPSLVRWNADKRYLAQLDERGLPVVPTLWFDRIDEASVAAAFDELATDVVVVKPVVGASAWRQERLRRGEPLPSAERLPPAGALVQPYLPAAESEGEYSFVFFRGELSHCAQKIPARGDYRVQSMYGAKERVHEPSPSELAQTQRVLESVDAPLLYARVDMMRGLDGELALMELELIEPYLYPEQGAGMGSRFARALDELLTA